MRRIFLLPVLCTPLVMHSAETPIDVSQFSVQELVFHGPPASPTDSPVRDVELTTVWRHETGAPELHVSGFWDGDGKGSPTGNVYKVRFCPVAPGKWTLIRYDVCTKAREVITESAQEKLTCDAPASRATFFHIVRR